MSDRYSLSEKAESQVLDVFAYTLEAFGLYQAEAYHAGLAHTFELLGDFPLMGPDAGRLFPGLRQFTFQSHTIFYTVSDAGVFIRQVLHQRMQARPDLFT
jgi:toxin ParE1/3/4